MILLGSFIAIELMLILSLAMYIGGRREVRSIWIRSDVLVGIIANIAMSLLIGGIVGLIATMLEWWEDGVQVPHVWIIVLSIGVTFWILMRLKASARRAGIVLFGDAVAAT